MRMLKNLFESQLIKSASSLVGPVDCMLLLYCRKFVMVSPTSPCFFSLTWFPVLDKEFPLLEHFEVNKEDI